MRFLRHKNGGGRIDETSESCAFSLVDRNSRIEKKSSVWSSAIKNSIVGNSTVASSVIENSAIRRSVITGGQIIDSLISAELVADYALIQNSSIFGKSRIVHTAHIKNCSFQNLTVTGDARLVDWENPFDGREGYISRGIWLRPPQILRLDGGLTITESVPGFAFCGCREYKVSHWLKIGDRYGATLGLTPDEVQQIREFLHTLP